jgi:hypothetical protein
MALVISDPHGNFSKVKCFLEYKPEEEHIILGDFLDSYGASDEDIIATFQLAIEAGATLLAGNHETPYLPNAHSYFRCSGNRASPIFFHFIAMYKDKLEGALVRDNFLLTHGGLSTKHGKPFITIEEARDWIQCEWNHYKNSPVAPESLSPIFDIGRVRGGYSDVSGPFWLTFNHEKYDKRFNQICGHTCSSDIRINLNGKGWGNTMHVCVDSPMFHCFNTITKSVEDFMVEEYKDKDQMRKILERTF